MPENTHSLSRGRNCIQYNSKRRERENRGKHTHSSNLIGPTQTRKYVEESINKLTRCKTYIVTLIQKSLLQKFNGAKFFEVTNNTNTGYAEIL